MNKQITFSRRAGKSLYSVRARVSRRSPPTCAQPVGKWKKTGRSQYWRLRLTTRRLAPYRVSTPSHSGRGSASSMPYPLAGWIYSAPAESSAPRKADKGDHAEVITFRGALGYARASISAWTGDVRCVNSQSSGLEQIFCPVAHHAAQHRV